MKIFTFLIGLFFTSQIFAQYCPQLGPDITLPCNSNTTTLTADLSQCQGNGLRQTNAYSITDIPFAPINNTGTLVNLSDDSRTGPLNIGFTFCFFGNSYNQFWIGSNGWVSFSPNQSTSFTSLPIPSNNIQVPRNCIMGPWQDWNPGIGGQIRYQTQGVAPCRRLVVSWTNVPFFSCTSTIGTFQIVIYETTNIIETHITNKPSCIQWAGGTAVHGIHNLAGNQAFAVPGRNSTQWTTTNEGKRWSPNGPLVVPIPTWYQVGNPVPIGTGLTINVTPGVYTCHLLYSTCGEPPHEICSQSGLGPDTIVVSPSINTILLNSNLTNPTCFDGCDGQASISVIGGTPNYSYLWLPSNEITSSISGLCSGNYTIIVTDSNGCQSTLNIVINNPPPFIFNQIISHN